MPKQKKVKDTLLTSSQSAKRVSHSSDIINMYEKIPKKFLDEAENPNFDLHQLKIPMRMIIVAPSGSGKTNFLLNLLSLFSKNNGTFNDITILTRNKAEPLYQWLEDETEGRISIKEGLHHMPKLDDMDKKENHLVIWDDLVLSKDLSPVEQYFIRARKLNCSCIFLSQSFFRIPKIIRGNSNYLIILKLANQRDCNLILSEFGLGITKKQLLKIYEDATREKFQPLLVDLDVEKEKRFRKGFKQFINLEDYPE